MGEDSCLRSEYSSTPRNFLPPPGNQRSAFASIGMPRHPPTKKEDTPRGGEEGQGATGGNVNENDNVGSTL